MFAVLALIVLATFTDAANLYGRRKSFQPDNFNWWDSANCGFSKYPDAGQPRSSYIVGGIDARPYEFPWQISLQRRAGSHFCGGSVIHPNWAITAAHCTDGETATNLQIVAGDHDRSAASTVRQTINVEAYFTHPDYVGATFNNDVSLLKLTTPVQFNENVTAVCAPQTTDSSYYFDWQSQITGWGSLRYGGPCCPQVLQWTWVDITNQTECQRLYTAPITAAMVCAGEGDYTQKDTCQGDSGGPLTIFNTATNQFELIGLTSWGYQCAAGKPGVYTNVPYLRDWIKGIIDANP